MTKQIPLTKGKFALVDDEDYEYLMQWKWYFHQLRKESGYAARMLLGKKMWMHRLINKTPTELKTDHIDGDKLNNQKKNLRNATALQNNYNSLKRKNTSYKYKGVTRHGNKWKSRIRANSKNIYIGLFFTEEEAALAYNEAALKYHGEFAGLNKIIQI